MNLVVLITAPSSEVGAEIARTLVEEHLAACVNIVPQIRSIYRWQGKIEDSPEALLIAKTTDINFTTLAARVAQIHPYTVPEVIALPITAGSPAYLEWLAAQLNPKA